MNNWILESKAHDAQGVIDNLISEIEDLESQVETLSGEKVMLEEENERLKEQIDDIINDNNA